MPRKRCEKTIENKLILPVIDPILVTFGKMQFSRSQLSHFLFMLLLFNRDHFEFLLTRIFLPQKSENLRPHSSNSIENATP